MPPTSPAAPSPGSRPATPSTPGPGDRHLGSRRRSIPLDTAGSTPTAPSPSSSTSWKASPSSPSTPSSTASGPTGRRSRWCRSAGRAASRSSTSCARDPRMLAPALRPHHGGRHARRVPGPRGASATSATRSRRSCSTPRSRPASSATARRRWHRWCRASSASPCRRATGSPTGSAARSATTPAPTPPPTSPTSACWPPASAPRSATRGRLQWALDECELARAKATVAREPDEAWWRVKDARSLRGAAVGVAQELAAWRERRAGEIDQPIRFVLPDLALVGIAQRPPADRSALGRVRGLDERHLRNGAAEGILDAVRAGQALPEGRASPPARRRRRPRAAPAPSPSCRPG